MLDARGHGLSAPIAPGLPQDPALDIAQAIEQLGLDAPIVMGHSVGARATARYASAFPDQVSRVILEDPPLVPQTDGARIDQWRDGFREQVKAFRAMTIDQIVAMGRNRSPNWHEDEFADWAIAKQQVDPDVTPFAGEPWQVYMARISAPTLLIMGEPGFGGLITPPLAQEAQALNPRISTVQIKAAGHNIRRENFPDYLAAVQAFLRKP
jgi:pimeloyl-ACP methyl ester carboxylesterase